MELAIVRKIVANILCIGLLIAVVSPLITAHGFAQTEIDVTVDSGDAIGVNYFQLGFQLDGPDIRLWRNRSELRDLAERSRRERLHRIHFRMEREKQLYEFAEQRPEPSYKGLDRLEHAGWK